MVTHPVFEAAKGLSRRLTTMISIPDWINTPGVESLENIHLRDVLKRAGEGDWGRWKFVCSPDLMMSKFRFLGEGCDRPLFLIPDLFFTVMLWYLLLTYLTSKSGVVQQNKKKCRDPSRIQQLVYSGCQGHLSIHTKCELRNLWRFNMKRLYGLVPTTNISFPLLVHCQHFRVVLCLCFKTSLSAKPFIWKWVL